MDLVSVGEILYTKREALEVKALMEDDRKRWVDTWFPTCCEGVGRLTQL